MSDAPPSDLAPPPPEPTKLDPKAGETWKARLDRDTFVLLVVTVLAFSFDSFVDPDLPGHLGFGVAHLETGHLASTDPYSYTVPGEPWVNHEWLFELGIACVYLVAGATGLVLLQALAWLASGILILALVRRSTRDLLPGAVSYILFIAGVVAAITIRPQLCTYLFFAIELWLLEGARAGRRGLLLLVPPLIAVWTNVHGGFLAGLGVFGLYCGGLILDALLARAAPGDLPAPDRRPCGEAAGSSPEGGERAVPRSGTLDPAPRRTAAIAFVAGPLAILATFVNPYGWHLHEWLRWSLVMPNPYVSEWNPLVIIRDTGTVDIQAVLFLVFVALSAAALIARGRSRTPLPHAIVLLVTAYLGIRHVRHVPFFAMSAAAFVPGALSDLYRRLVPAPARGDDLDPTAAKRMRVVFVLLGAAAITGKLLFPSPTHELHLWLEARHDWPTGAITHIDQRLARGAPERRLFVFFDWAQLAIWRWHPRLEVFYDGRHRTVYMKDADGVIGKRMPHVEAMHFDLLSHDDRRVPGLDWRDALEYPPGRGAELVLLPAKSPGVARLRTHPGFRVEFEDSLSVLFVRRRPGEPDVPPVLGPEPPVKELPFDPRPGLGR